MLTYLMGISLRISFLIFLLFFSPSRKILSIVIFNAKTLSFSCLISISWQITFSRRFLFSTVVENNSASTFGRRFLCHLKQIIARHVSVLLLSENPASGNTLPLTGFLLQLFSCRGGLTTSYGAFSKHSETSQAILFKSCLLSRANTDLVRNIRRVVTALYRIRQCQLVGTAMHFDTACCHSISPGTLRSLLFLPFARCNSSYTVQCHI